VTFDSSFVLVRALFNFLIRPLRPHAFYYYVSCPYFLKVRAIYLFFPVWWHSRALLLCFWFVHRGGCFRTDWYRNYNCPCSHLIVQVYSLSYILLVCISGIYVLPLLQRIHSIHTDSVPTLVGDKEETSTRCPLETVLNTC